MKRSLITLFSIVCLTNPSLCFAQAATAQTASPETAVAQQSKPRFKDGLAQVVPGFKDSSQWIKHDLWVETDFDSDMDGKNDRMHVSVCRQKQTDTEGLKVPVIYNTSPYFCLLYTSPSPRDQRGSRMPSSA